MQDIIEDANLTRKTLKVVERISREFIKLCKKAIEEEPENVDNNVMINFNGVEVNASEIMQRVADTAILAKKIVAYENDLQFKIKQQTKPPNYSIEWTQKEDAMLLLGVYRHGLGNWEAIRDDHSLGLSKLIFLNNSDKTDQTPKATHLSRRVDLLFKTIRDEDEDERFIQKKKNKSPQLNNIIPDNITTTNATGKKQPKEEQVPTVDFDEALLSICKNLMATVRDTLKRFQKLTERDDLADERKIELTRTYLLNIGTEINKIVARETSYDNKQLQNHLWHYASTFTHETGPRLQRLYNAVQAQEKPIESLRKRPKVEDSGSDSPPSKRRKRDNKRSESNNAQLKFQKKEAASIKQKKR